MKFAQASIYALLAYALLALPAPCEILINEVHANHPDEPGLNQDSNYEYIELKSTTSGEESTNDLTLLLLDTTGGNIGGVDEIWPLAGLRTGTNGLLILGNGYDAPVGGPWKSAIDEDTRGADPPGFGDDDIRPNSAFSILLVRGYTGSDTDDYSVGNVTIDNTAWTAIVDSVGIGERGVNKPLSLADVTQLNFSPDNLSRKEGNLTANSADAWYGGEIAGSLPTDIAFTEEFFGGFKGSATPGRRNLSGSAGLAEIRINEVNVNPPPSSDANYEYIEVRSESGESVITDGYHLVLIDSKSDNEAAVGEPQNLRGNIREAWDLSGFSTGLNGLMLIGDKYQSSNPWGNFLDPQTVLREPNGFGAGEIGANDGFSLLLVSGYTGTTGTDLDTDDNGTLDAKPWSQVHDSIGFGEVGTEILSYAAEFGGDVTQTYHPDNLSRKGGNTAANSADAWYGGAYGGPAGGQSPTNISFNDNFFGGFRGQATPGRGNNTTSASQRTNGAILINELSVNPPDILNPQDGKLEDGQEFIEIISTSRGIDGLNGLHLIILDTSGPAEIREAINLSPLSTGANGLLLIGDSLDDANLHPDEFKTYFERATHLEDPDGVDKGDFGPNSNYVFLIVSGFQTPVGALDLGSPPWTDIKDSIGIAPLPGITIANVAQTEFNPDHVARIPGELGANDASVWYGGDFITDAEGRGIRGEIGYSSKWFGPFKGASTPGSFNHAASPSTIPALINEVDVNPLGGDQNFEFVELLGPAGAQSLVGYHLLLIEVRGSNTGTIMEAWNLDGAATGHNGLVVIGDGYTDTIPPGGPYNTTVSTDTRFFDPPEFDAEDLGGSGEVSRSNEEFCLLLVTGFVGAVDTDLDADNVNGFDTTPWSNLVDSVGYREFDADAGVNVGINYASADLSQTLYEPDAFARRNGNTTPNSTAAWYGGSLVAGGISFDPSNHFGLDTPGELTPGNANLPTGSDIEDPDNDGLSTLLETALGMDPQRADLENYPIKSGVITDNGNAFLFFQYAQLPGGTGTDGVDYFVESEGITYTVESSTDLETWQTTGNDLVVVDKIPAVTPAGPIEILRVRHSSSGQPLFFRLKVSK